MKIYRSKIFNKKQKYTFLNIKKLFKFSNILVVRFYARYKQLELFFNLHKMNAKLLIKHF